MQKSVKVLRLVAIVFLFGATATVFTSIPTSPHPFLYISLSVNLQIALLNLSLSLHQLHTGLAATFLGFPVLLAIDNTSNAVAFSSVFIGYLLSFTAARKAREVRTWPWYASMFLSTVGVLGFLNEALRLVTHHDLRFVISCPPLLLLFDWLHSRDCSPLRMHRPRLLRPIGSEE